MNKFLYRFLKIVKPLVRWWGKLQVRFHTPRIKGKDYYKIREQMYPFDVILSCTKGELSNLINPSEICHGALYAGKIEGGYIPYTIESVGEGVIKKTFVEHLLRKDEVIILRPNFIFDSNKAIEFLRSAIGSSYDYEFQSNDDEFYCFELVAEMFKASSQVDFKKYKVLGYDYYDAKSFLESGLFRVIVDTRGQL